MLRSTFRFLRNDKILIKSYLNPRFSHLLAEQVSSFEKNGFLTMKRPSTISIQDINNLNIETLDLLQASQISFKYMFWRYFNRVNTSKKRHSIPLPFTKALQKVFSPTISFIRPFLETQLQCNSPLVELSSIITFPGAEEQKKHSDIPFSENKIISGFIALSNIHLENGPTYIYSGTHTWNFHSQIPKHSNVMYYNSDGTLSNEIENNDILKEYSDDSLKNSGYSEPPIPILLEIGDILLFDTKIVHYGSANISNSSRALLCFAFQYRNGEGDAEKIDGFTYHCDASVVGNYLLQDF